MDSLDGDNARVSVKCLVSTFLDKDLSRVSAGSKDKKDGGKSVKTPGSTYSASQSTGCVSEKSSKDIPLHFRKEQWETADGDYSAYETDLSSKDIPLHFDNKIKHGMLQHLISPMGPSRLKVQCPPSAAYAVHISDHRAPDDFIHRREEEVICDICRHATAVKTCLTCNASYCEYDVRQHYTVKALQRHTLTDVCDEVEGKRCLHYQKSLDFLCRTDQMQICSICAKGNHRGHDIVSQRHHAPNQTPDGAEYWDQTQSETAVPAPRHLTKGHSEATAVSLKWTKGDNMEGVPQQFLVTVESQGKESLAIHTKDCYKILSDLQADTEYVISVSTVLNDQCSKRISITVHTELCLREALSRIGLEDQYDNKLTLSSALQIDQDDTSDKNLESAKSLHEAFLKKLMMLNANARSVKCVSSNVNTDRSDAINPLDLITALFLCSDSLLQQYMVVKMALCQFAVPLLLPNYETREITMMLWSMQEIVQTCRPSIQAFRKFNYEERIVLSDIPLVSFVRLGRTISSKSQMLNKLFSNTQEYHDIFYHQNMMCGDVSRRISDGLVEISWYLPCGNRNTDKYTEPLAIANLRGDIRVFDEQLSFLCQTSAAVYIFCDESEVDYFKILEGKDVKAKIILISSVQGKTSTLKMMTVKPNLKTTNVSQKKKSDAELIKALQESISKMLENCPDKVSVANLADRARCCGILVDEDSDECQSAWKNAGKITAHIANTSEFKDKQLPFQGNIWKELSRLETEYWRLQKVGNQNTEVYRKSLKTKEKELRGKQQRFEMTAAMLSFLHGMVTSEVQRYYFLKWLEIDLDNLSRHQLSALQDRYKELSEKFPQDTEKIAEIDKQISVCSLGLVHFFRECGQLYECVSHLPEYSYQKKNIQQLPRLCAQMLLNGFPLELVDGDAANIPMKWITEVLTELHHILHPSSKLKVITIIGAENSGKSTLLNTMFGLRFAVSKGTCTRGAFIQLISVNKAVRKELGCDCIMIIDTEGLKPHQMVQDDHSHERDKEVASLAVALSDITIVTISRDNSEKKDILEMVLHAFTRLKNVGRKPLCHFVHTNMSAKPAVEKKKRGTELVKQLNEMIWKDTRMKKANVTKISDVMEFDPDSCTWYIPPVWHGTPQMASFSVDYSETLHALKKRLIGDLKKCQQRGDLMHFISSVDNFWKGV